MFKICLDPGHGGYDSGAVGNDLEEKNITLDICLRLKPLLEHKGFSVVLTRDGDYAPGNLEGQLNAELQKRCDIADAFQANAFISVHVNSSDITSPSGVEILVAGLGGEAEKLANRILPYLVGLGEGNRHVKVQNVLVLKNTAMPAILTENGFISNEEDAKRLADPDYRQKIAEAHMMGICDHFNISHDGGGSTMNKIAILKFTPEDEWSAKDIDAKHGGVANFTRQGAGKAIPPEAMLADLLIVIGGPTTGHKNEILLSGKDKYETASKVSDYLKK
jgi:hypothetical protein